MPAKNHKGGLIVPTNLSDIIKSTIDLRAHIESVTGQQFKKETASWHLPECPFCGSHSGFKIATKTPHLWKCFNCSEKQDSIIGFEKRRLNCDAKEALKALANRYGITTATDKRVGEKTGASFLYSPESIDATPNPNRVLARTIWENATPLPLENAARILQKRGFGKYAKKIAPTLAQIARINTWKGTKKLALPQIENGEIVGLHMICQDLHTKNDLGEKAGALLLSNGKNKDTCMIVESLFNALALSVLGYTALIMFGCENKKAITNWLPTARQKCNKVILWLDRGQEERSQKYADEFGLDAVVTFAPEKEKNYAVKDMLAESDIDFLLNVERYIAEAYARSNQEQARQANKAKPEPEAAIEDHADFSTPIDGNGFQAIEMPSIETAIAAIKASKKKANVLLSPTGSGKSTICGAILAERLRAGQYTIFGSNIKEDLNQFAETYLFPLLTEKETARVQIICRGADTKINDSTWLVLTHKTLLTRKGFSMYHYAALLWLGKKTSKKEWRNAWLLIDECQAYLRNQIITADKGGRVIEKRFKDHNITRLEIISKCLATANRGNCSQCWLCEKNFLYADTNGIIDVRTYIEGKTGEDYQPFKFPEFKVCKSARFKTLLIEEIEKTTQPFKRFYTSQRVGEQEAANYEEIFADLLKCAFAPRGYTFSPVNRATGQPVKWEELRTEYEIAENTSDNEKILDKARKDIKKRHAMPAATCAVTAYHFQDMSSLRYAYQHAGKIILLGATMRQDEVALLKACCPDVEFYRVRESKHTLDELLVTIFRPKLAIVKEETKKKKVINKTVAIQPIIDSLPKGTRAIIFMPKKEQATELFLSFPKGYPVSLLKGDSTQADYRNEERENRIGITWELGPLGFGANRPKDFWGIIEVEIFLPIIAHGHGADITQEKVDAGHRYKAEDTLIQCGGRELRILPGLLNRKVITLHNTEKITPSLDTIRQEWQGMVKTPIKFLVVDESQEYLTKAVTQYYQDGTLPEQTEAEFIKDKLAEKAKREMSETERASLDTPEAKAEYERKRDEMKLEKTLKRLISKGRNLKEQGKTWGEIYVLLNLIRHKDLADTVKREIGF
jgi:hypothetical protein